METLKKLNYLLDKKLKLKIVYTFILILIGSAAELIGVAIVLPIVDIAMGTEAVETNKMALIITGFIGSDDKNTILLWMAGITVVIYLIKDIYLYLMYRYVFRFSANIKRHMATRLMKAYLKQPYSYFLKRNTSELIRSVNLDSAQLYEIVNNCMLVASYGLTSLGIVIYLSITNLVLTLVVAGLLAMCALLILLVLQKHFRRYGRENQRLSGYLIRYLQQSFEGIKEIKLLGAEEYFIKNYNETYSKQADISVGYSTNNLIPKYIIEVVCIGGILGYLAVNVLVNPNYMEVMPQLAIFCLAAFKLLPSVNAMSTYINTIIYHKASIDLVYHDIKEADELERSFENNSDSDGEISFEKEICVKDVCFNYDSSDKVILKNGNIVIPKGHSVAFVGASGGGKTTTADIILSLLSPVSGSIMVDGHDIKENILGWRKKIGYIPQAIYLTDDSIRENVAFGIEDNDIDDDEVWRALRQAQLEDFVLELKDGIDTKVGERGVRISGGQRQRIGIARALYRNPEILVFDEATSALDNETEKEVMRAIESLQGTKTIIMIAHRLSTIENCDEVYRIEEGNIVRER